MQAESEAWGYSICATPLEPGLPLILGINWGGKADEPEQKEMPARQKFQQQIAGGDYSFLRRSSALMAEYAGINVESGHFNYSNLCFFRTPKIDLLTREDYRHSWPILKRLIERLAPPYIICLGTSAIDHLEESTRERRIPHQQARRQYRAYAGTIISHPFYALPHPNARVPIGVREDLWKGAGIQFSDS